MVKNYKLNHCKYFSHFKTGPKNQAMHILFNSTNQFPVYSTENNVKCIFSVKNHINFEIN